MRASSLPNASSIGERSGEWAGGKTGSPPAASTGARIRRVGVRRRCPPRSAAPGAARTAGRCRPRSPARAAPWARAGRAGEAVGPGRAARAGGRPPARAAAEVLAQGRADIRGQAPELGIQVAGRRRGPVVFVQRFEPVGGVVDALSAALNELAGEDLHALSPPELLDR